MENPATTPHAAPAQQEDRRLFVFLRTMLSAAVFGAIGTWVGAHIGKYGNAPGRNMARPIVKWTLGGFSALVAAYSSLKAEEQRQPEHPQRVTPPEHGQASCVDSASGVSPEARVAVNDAESQGKLQQMHKQHRA